MSEKSAHIVLVRLRDNGIQTIGRAWAMVNEFKNLEFVTLEPSWVLNESYISCAPCGTYTVKKRYSKEFGHHFHLQDVPGRSMMLMHVGNFFNNTSGCVLAGERFDRLPKDQFVDVVNSAQTMRRLDNIMPDEFLLTIKEHEEFQSWQANVKREKADGQL